MHLVNHPDDIQHVLRTHARNYDKATRTTAFLREVTGESLLTSNGEAWLRRRQVLQPAFHRQAVDGFADIMRTEAAALVEKWRPGTTVEAAGEMMRVTFRVVARALFGAQVPAETLAALEAPIGVLLEESFARHGRPLGFTRPRFSQALAALDAAVAKVLESARREGLLALMMDAGFSQHEIRDESITFLLAGHETTANALTWLFAFLARDAGEQDRCARDAGALDRTLQETLRLAPPIWILERHAIDADVIGGYDIPAGASVLICPYTVHRHPAFWEQPDQFRPDRFLQEPPAAYLPFGLGPRFCIGREFALMEARIIASAVLETFRIEPISNNPAVAVPGITLRVRGGLPLKLLPR
jgi:cytochrome P450